MVGVAIGVAFAAGIILGLLFGSREEPEKIPVFYWDSPAVLDRTWAAIIREYLEATRGMLDDSDADSYDRASCARDDLEEILSRIESGDHALARRPANDPVDIAIIDFSAKANETRVRSTENPAPRTIHAAMEADPGSVCAECGLPLWAGKDRTVLFGGGGDYHLSCYEAKKVA